MRPAAFGEISGEVVNTVLFTLVAVPPPAEHRLNAFRLIRPKSPEEKDRLLREALRAGSAERYNAPQGTKKKAIRMCEWTMTIPEHSWLALNPGPGAVRRRTEVGGRDQGQVHHPKPGDDQFRPLRHTLTLKAKLPATVRAGWHQIGLRMPDASSSLRLDPRYAVRGANRDAVWWTDAEGRFGINVLGTLQIAE